MARHRFYTPPSAIEHDRLTLDASESHHLRHVLRLRPGTTVWVFDGLGNEYVCRVEGFDRSQAHLAILEHTRPAVESPLALTLAHGLTKGEKFDLIIQKATELGVRRIVPLITTRTASSGIHAVSPSRLQRWRRIALEATKQCGRTRLTDITPPVEWNRFLAELPHPALLFSERGGRSLSDRLLVLGNDEPSICLMTGPEGGWQDQEIEAAEVAGAVLVSLGPRILRTETAAIVAISLVQYRWGDLKK
jgi:16S rRNA (uracil1498-N3)-methyltransferase